MPIPTHPIFSEFHHEIAELNSVFQPYLLNIDLETFWSSRGAQNASAIFTQACKVQRDEIIRHYQGQHAALPTDLNVMDIKIFNAAGWDAIINFLNENIAPAALPSNHALRDFKTSVLINHDKYYENETITLNKINAKENACYYYPFWVTLGLIDELEQLIQQAKLHATNQQDRPIADLFYHVDGAMPACIAAMRRDYATHKKDNPQDKRKFLAYIETESGCLSVGLDTLQPLLMSQINKSYDSRKTIFDAFTDFKGKALEKIRESVVLPSVVTTHYHDKRDAMRTKSSTAGPSPMSMRRISPH